MTEETLFHLAVQLPAAERAAFLEKMCAGDNALRQRVAALLHAADNPGDFLGLPPVPVATTAEETLPLEGPGSRIGPYKLLQQIGEGGMGTVFMAEQIEPVRRLVALKVIKPGMDSRQVVARFEAERQALALMDHPNIARVLDAGTTESGRPYFVMELVKGVPLTKYCDEHRLSPTARLELFVPICRAVQHAHQKGIIHRDLKPSNVLVALYDGKPVPKVIDFGVAKATGQQLTDKTLFTGFGGVVGTLEYMSPEQAELNQLDVDTRADIYSLGVLLYELLTGTTPLERKRLRAAALLECLRLIREEEPPKPSTRLSTAEGTASIAANRGLEPRKLSSLVRGDLDWIVMKCLEKDRDRRYETANGLASDIQRYLADEPVLASPPSAAYRLRKFARRHKSGLLTVGVIGAVVLLASVGVSWALWERAAQRENQRTEQGRRETETEQAVMVALAKADEWEQRARKLPCTTNGEAKIALAAWRDASSSLAEADAALTTGAGTDRLRGRVNVVRSRIADGQTRTERKEKLFENLDSARLQHANWVDNSFDYGGAAALYQKAFAAYGLELKPGRIAELTALIQAEEPPIREALLTALVDWYSCATLADNQPTVEELRALAAAADDNPWRTRFLTALVARDQVALRNLSLEARKLSLPPSSLVLLALSLFQTGDRDEALALFRWARHRHPTDFFIHAQLGVILIVEDSHPSPLDLEEGIGCLRAALALQPNSVIVHNHLGLAFRTKGQVDDAIAEFKKTIELDPTFALAHCNLGLALNDKEQWDQAIVACKKAIELDPNRSESYNNLGLALHGKHQFDEAIVEYKKAVKINPKGAASHFNLANALSDKKLWDEAISEYTLAIKIDSKIPQVHLGLGRALAEKNQLDDAVFQFRMEISLNPREKQAYDLLGHALGEMKQWREAIAAYERAIEIDPKCAQAYFNLGHAYSVNHQVNEAIIAYRKAIELDPKDAKTHNNLGLALADNNLWDDAIVAYRKAIELDPKIGGPHNNLANALDAKGLMEEAIAEYKIAIELEPNNATTYFNLGVDLCAKKQWDDAIRAYRRAVELDPKLVPAHINLGVVLADKKQWDEAITEYRKAIEIDPKLAPAHYSLGLALVAKNQLDDAIASFKKAVEHDPTHARAQYKLGMALGAKNQLDDAVAAFRKAIELDRNFLAAHYNLGVCLAMKNQLDDAIDELKKTVELDPKFAQAHVGLAQALVRKGRFMEAKTSFQQAMDLMPEKHPLRPTVLQLMQNCEALLVLEAKLPDILAGKAKPGNNRERYGFMEVCRLQGRHAAAVKFYTEAIEADPPKESDWTDNRYKAACSAVLAAAGQGKNPDKLEDAERVRLRKQALEWLRADLAFWEKTARSGNDMERQLIKRIFPGWFDNSDLSTVRDPEALKKLPAEEQEAWRKLWADVAELLKKAGDAK